MATRLARFTRRVREVRGEKYTALMGMVWDPEELRESFGRQDGRKAPGVDGVKKSDYAEGVEERLAELSARLKRMGYRPKPVRRVYIPKGDGRYRPLGIPCFEGRLVQDRLSLILQAIWEPEFRDCSYGFRPGRSAHDALRRVGEIITNEHTQWVVEADIKGFFDHVSHERLMKCLAHRIVDPNFLRLIRRILKAGVMEDGVVGASEEGTPQGGLVSPVLANIYLHYVLDVWFERFRKTCRGTARLVRFADDFIACFQYEEEARRFLIEMTERLAACDLEVAPDKTAILPFGDRTSHPLTFNFLGFTHFVGRSRRGAFVVNRKTERKRFTKKLKQLKETLRMLRLSGGKAMVTYVELHLRGHMRYYGVSGNMRSLRSYCHHALKQLCKWLNRRSQRRSISWDLFYARIASLMPKPRIYHDLYPQPPWRTRTGSRMV